MPSFSALFGSGSAAGDSNAAAYTPPLNFECPNVVIRPGAGTLTASSDGADATALNLRYQVGIATTARECRLVGTTVSIKVGVQGRVILGPKGDAGTVDVPLRVAVVHEATDSKTIVTKLERFAVTVPPSDTNVLFSHVSEGLDFPMPKGGEIDSYVIYIGFDPIGAQELDKTKKKPAPKQKPIRPARSQS